MIQIMQEDNIGPQILLKMKTIATEIIRIWILLPIISQEKIHHIRRMKQW